MMKSTHAAISSIGILVALAQPGCAGASQPPHQGIQLLSYKSNEIDRFIHNLGATGGVDRLVRIPGNDGIRVVLQSGRAFDLLCNGEIRKLVFPSSQVFFDEHGEAFAWYEKDILRFRHGIAASETWNVIRVDPQGRYFVYGVGAHPDGLTRIYRTEDPSKPFGLTPILGYSAHVFSSRDKVIVVGRTRESTATRLIIYTVKHSGLEAHETIEVREPRAWFSGTLNVEDASPDLSHLLFAYHRDPPTGTYLYMFDVSTRSMRKQGRQRSFNLFASCDPIRRSK